jgi:hypothetical protein
MAFGRRDDDNPQPRLPKAREQPFTEMAVVLS